MTFLAPLLGIFGVAVPVILVLYILRVRRRRTVVSSTLLWRSRTVDRQASVPWQRLRPSWLLLLQLAAAAVLVLALTQPALARPATLGPDTAVVIDASGPMQATDVAPSRFAAAVARARDLVAELAPGQRMTLIAMDGHPRILASTSGDRAALNAALDGLRPSAGLADLTTALSLASAAPGAASERRVVVISDGVVETSGPPLHVTTPVQLVAIGRSGENLGISGITVSAAGRAAQVAVSVSNYGRLRHHTTVETRADGHLIDATPVDLEPASGHEVLVDLPAGAATVTATLAPHDAFALDDTASAVVRPPHPLRAVLVTQHNTFLEQALRLRGDLSLEVVAPAAYHPDAGVDLWIFDGFTPRSLPQQPYWLVGPPASAALGAGDELRPGPLRPAQAGDPLTSGVDLSGVAVAQSRDLLGSAFGRAVIDSEAGPVLLLRDATPRAALLGFDLHDSDLPLSPAFPVLVERISEYLAPEAVPPQPVEPGSDVLLPVGAAGGAAGVTLPDGATTTIRAAPGSTAAVFNATDETGLYRARTAGGGSGGAVFAVDALDPARSQIQPLDRLPITASSSPGSPQTAPPLTFNDLWPWLAVLALLLLSAEWMVFHRGR